MINKEVTPKINIKYVAVFAVAVLLSWVLHELAHWVAGEWLGYTIEMRLNSSGPVSGDYVQPWHYTAISAAGPLFTLCEALVIFVLMMQRRRVLLYPFLFICFFMRLFAAIISFINPNDEARISTAFGLGKFTLPAVVTLLLFLLVYKVSKTYGFRLKFNLVNVGLALLFSIMIIMADMYFKVRLM